MSNPLIVEFDADITKLQAKLAVAQAELKRATAGVNRTARGGDVENTAEAIVQREAAAAHYAAIGKQIAANEVAQVSFNRRLREGVEHLEKFKGGFEGARGTAGGLAGGLPGLAFATGPVGIAIAAAALIGGTAFKLAENAAEEAHHIESLSSELDISTGQIHAWSRAAEMAAVSTEKWDRFLLRLAIAAEKANDETVKLANEGAKAVTANNDIVSRGGETSKPTKPSGKFVDIHNVPSLDALEASYGVQQQYQQFLNARQVQKDSGAIPDPWISLRDYAFKTRAILMQTTPEATKLRQELAKYADVQIPVKNIAEAFERLDPKFQTTFEKLKIHTRDEAGEKRPEEDIYKDFFKAFGGIESGPERTRIMREIGGRGAMDPNLIKFASGFTKNGLGDVASFDDPAIKRGAELFLKEMQAKAAIKEGEFETGLEVGEKALQAYEGAVAGLKAASEGVSGAFGKVVEAADAAATALGNIASKTGAADIVGGNAANTGGSTDQTGTTQFASGGHVRGPGTGTSDSILARLSNGEFVMRAEAVSRIGVGALDRMNRFAEGGLVGFAGGGAVGGRSPVHLHLGGNSYALHGDGGVVDALVSEAHRQNMTSAGVKPSWYAGRPSGR